MEKRRLGRTELEVSVVGFGGAPIGVLETEQEQVAQVLRELLDAGVNVIDTAAGYRGSEEAIGSAVGDRRDDFVLVSKCGQAFEGLDGEAWSATVIQQTIDRSLQRLQTDHLDVVLLHTCDLETLERGAALAALEAARKAGKTRFIGYSGDNDAALFAITEGGIDVLETSVNICDQANIERVLPTADAHQVGVIGKRPIANAAWKRLQDQPGFYEQYAKPYTERFAAMELPAEGCPLEDGSLVPWPEAALRFTLAQPGLHTAIVGTTSRQHALANLAAAAAGPLPTGVVERLRTAFQRAASADPSPWLGLT